nr:unnamed protein product [Callosobruchus chinensis]
MVLLAVCDSNYRFTYIDTGFFGKASDSSIFKDRARRYIECSFGILSNKWRISHRPFNVNTINAELIMKVCCTLHNFVRERDGVDLEHNYRS